MKMCVNCTVQNKAISQTVLENLKQKPIGSLFLRLGGCENAFILVLQLNGSLGGYRVLGVLQKQ